MDLLRYQGAPALHLEVTDDADAVPYEHYEGPWQRHSTQSRRRGEAASG